MNLTPAYESSQVHQQLTWRTGLVIGGSLSLGFAVSEASLEHGAVSEEGLRTITQISGESPPPPKDRGIHALGNEAPQGTARVDDQRDVMAPHRLKDA